MRLVQLGFFTLAALAAVKGGTMLMDADIVGPTAELSRQISHSAVGTASYADAPPVNPEIGKAAAAIPEILVAIAKEKDGIVQRQKVLDTQQAAVDLQKAAILAQTANLTALRNEIQSLLDNTQDNHKADVSRLVNIYMAMKPVQAADILNGGDLEVSVMVLAAMPERASGPIFAVMAPDKARAISKIIFERAHLPGDQKPVYIDISVPN